MADCPHDNQYQSSPFVKIKAGAGCTSSQDDTPGIFAEPWDYSETTIPEDIDWKEQMKRLIPAIQVVSQKQRGDHVEIQLQEGRYLRVLFRDKATGEESIGEFYFTPNDTTVQFRIGSTASGKDAHNNDNDNNKSFASLKNIERAEMIRKQLRYTKIPVLRNRSRALFFGESNFDTFGPGSAMLGPPAEMSTGELEGRLSDNVIPKKSDFLQMFPRAP